MTLLNGSNEMSERSTSYSVKDVGGTPYCFLNADEKCDGFLKPTSLYMSTILFFPSRSILYASSRRLRISHFSGDSVLTFLKSRLNVARLRPVYLAKEVLLYDKEQSKQP